LNIAALSIIFFSHILDRILFVRTATSGSGSTASGLAKPATQAQLRDLLQAADDA
jgi:hypothetical protein